MNKLAKAIAGGMKMSYGSISRSVPMAALDFSMRRFKEYKVVRVNESGCATILLGASIIPTDIMEVKLNELAKQGWQVICQVIEHQRFLLFWKRESLIVTLGR